MFGPPLCQLCIGCRVRGTALLGTHITTLIRALQGRRETPHQGPAVPSSVRGCDPNVRQDQHLRHTTSPVSTLPALLGSLPRVSLIHRAESSLTAHPLLCRFRADRSDPLRRLLRCDDAWCAIGRLLCPWMSRHTGTALRPLGGFQEAPASPRVLLRVGSAIRVNNA